MWGFGLGMELAKLRGALLKPRAELAVLKVNLLKLETEEAEGYDLA